MKKNFNILIEKQLSDFQKQSLKKGLKCRLNFLNDLILIKNASYEEETILKSRLEEICKYKIDQVYDVFELEDLDKYDFFYCSGQCKGSPDTSIQNCVWPLELNVNSSFNYSDYCPICKNGLIQTAPLKIKGLTTKHFNKKLVTPFWTYWIINNEFKEILAEANLSGLDFLPLYNYKNEEITTNIQLKPTKILKGTVISEAFNITHDDKCNCKNFHYGIKNGIVKLKLSVKESLLDFNELEEHCLSRLNGMYIISKKMMHIMVNNGFHPNIDIEFIPVEFI